MARPRPETHSGIVKIGQEMRLGQVRKKAKKTGKKKRNSEI